MDVARIVDIARSRIYIILGTKYYLVFFARPPGYRPSGTHIVGPEPQAPPKL